MFWIWRFGVFKLKILWAKPEYYKNIFSWHRNSGYYEILIVAYTSINTASFCLFC
jgi:hypothetical protein